MWDEISKIINSLQDLLTKEHFPEVEAVLVGGSVGRGDTDQHSDLDVFLMITDDKLFDFLTTGMKDIVYSLGEPMLFRGPIYVTNFGFSFTTIYDSFLVCQFNVNSQRTITSNPMNGQRGQILFDRTNYYTTFLAESKNVALDIGEIFRSSFTFFWIRAITSSKEIQRGNLWLAIKYLSDLRDQMITLERLRKRILPPGLNFNKPAKKVEKDFENGFEAVLSQTMCDHSKESIKLATLFCVNWYATASEEFARMANLDHLRGQDISRRLSKKIERDLAITSKIT